MAENSDFINSIEIIDGAIKAPYLMTIYGNGGVGKTWLAKYADDPFYIGIEPGVNLVPAKKLKRRPATADQTMEVIKYLCKRENKGICKTVVIDSLGFFQSFVYKDIIKKNPTEGKDDKIRTIECIADYGYQAGYTMAIPYWEKLLTGIDALQARGMNVILITHSQLKNGKTSGGEPYKYNGFALSSSNAGDVCELLRRRSDFVLYMESEANIIKKKGGFGGSVSMPLVGSRPRVFVHTRATSSFFAKVRAIDETKIKDTYEILPHDIDGSSAQMFNDLIN